MPTVHYLGDEEFRAAVVEYWENDRAGKAQISVTGKEKRKSILDHASKLGRRDMDRLVGDLVAKDFQSSERSSGDLEEFVTWLEGSVGAKVPAETKTRIGRSSSAPPSSQSSPQADGGS